MSSKHGGIFASFQKLGSALLLPIAVLPVAALLLRFGVLLKIPFITAAGNAIFANLPVLFGIGVAVGISKDNAGAAGLAGAVGHFVILLGAQAIDSKINMGVFSGLIGGITGGVMYNKFHDIKLPEWLGFFGGKRFVPIVTSLVCLIWAGLAGYAWPYFQGGLNSVGNWITGAGGIGIFIYGFLNRLLIPLGLHHILNTLVWFEFGDFTNAAGEVVKGDLHRFFAGDPTAGAFMTGFFPIMMFGLPAAALAMYTLAKKENKAAVGGVLFAVAFTAFLTGITEPIEFIFMFLAPGLYLIHALLTGIAGVIMYLFNVKLGFGFSAGLIDYVMNFNLATKPLLLIPIGLVSGAVYYALFYVAIKVWNLKTPGREDADEGSVAGTGDSFDEETVQQFDRALGGLENLTSIGSCITRLRLVVADPGKVDDAALKALGAKGIIRPGSNSVQIVLGQVAEQIAVALNKKKTS